MTTPPQAKEQSTPSLISRLEFLRNWLNPNLDAEQIAIVQDAMEELAAATERLNAPVPEVEAQVVAWLVEGHHSGEEIVRDVFDLDDKERAEQFQKNNGGALRDLVSADLARDLGRRLAEASAEVVRLNQWADSFTDSHLKERQTGDALVKESLQRAEAAERQRDEYFLRARTAEDQLAEAVAATVERCAKVCEARHAGYEHTSHDATVAMESRLCAAAIRGSSEGGGNG